MRASRLLLAAALALAPSLSLGADGPFVAAAPGRVARSADAVRVGAGTTAIVARIVVDEGDRVDVGAELATLSCEPEAYALEEARHRHAELQADLQRLRNGPRVEERREAEANVARATAVLREAEEQADRFGRLTSGRSVSRARLSGSLNELAARRAELAIATHASERLHNGERPEVIAAAEARTAAAAAQIGRLEAALDLCTIRSPIAGMVLRKHVTVGELVSTVAPRTLFEITGLGRTRVIAEVDERDLGAICLHQGAVVTAEGYPGVAAEASVTELKPVMGRRTVLSDDPAEKSDRDVREVVLSTRTPLSWPIGLRVVIRFHPCAGTTDEVPTASARGAPAQPTAVAAGNRPVGGRSRR
ncbi:HlyD family secretion protein [Acuticoccus mangrovi]|uniref:Efflux RND transporter periplasmic adaptor subunit n=1 Tax=Acuticoccus mangrovi TaxID=2796142 RepID=A0A934IU13_9HYPH|nr:efflux RND transporter periplasmic adaptor subunit [Acuticoccus mangrovi]MBJ3778162.1 efflux RND transporter periplasmic adaptor subunit [Acuticoccus mangrovi]